MLYKTYPEISKLVSKLSIYHEIKTEDNHWKDKKLLGKIGEFLFSAHSMIDGYKRKETIYTKIILVYRYNLLLTIPLLLTILYILNLSTDQTSYFGLPSSVLGLVISLPLILGLLFMLRSIATPTRKDVFWNDILHKMPFLDKIPGLKNGILLKEKFNGTTQKEIENIKSDITTFYSALIFGTVLYLIVRFCADYYLSGSFFSFFEKYIPPSDFLIVIIITILVFFLTSFLMTTYGELILIKGEPIDKIKDS